MKHRRERQAHKRESGAAGESLLGRRQKVGDAPQAPLGDEVGLAEIARRVPADGQRVTLGDIETEVERGDRRRHK